MNRYVRMSRDNARGVQDTLHTLIQEHQRHHVSMVGNLPEFNSIDGRSGAMGGFQNLAPTPAPMQNGDAWAHVARAILADPKKSDQFMDGVETLLSRGDVSNQDILGVIRDMVKTNQEMQTDMQRLVSTSMSAFPVRENLEAEAKDITPRDTPFRNMLPRHGGAGMATAWKILVSLGGGWGSSYDQPNGGSATRVFFSETGAPAETVSAYQNRTATYKLLGSYRSITGFAMAAGANFQNQEAIERVNAIRNLMLNEENALINGDSTSTAAPWGDGTNALAFDGIINLITTGNGVPSAQIQTAVGAPSSFSYIENQLRRIWNSGGDDPYIMLNGQDLMSIIHLATQSNAVQMHRIITTDGGDTNVGIRVTGFIHPITGQIVPFIPSRFMPQGTIIFGGKTLPNGDAALDLDILPQVNLPELAPDQQIQGYTLQPLAPSQAAPQVYPFIVSIYEVLRLKSGVVFAKSTGVSLV